MINAGMAELVDAPHLQGTKSFAVHAVKGSSITHEPEGFDVTGSSPVPRTILYNLKAIERGRK